MKNYLLYTLFFICLTGGLGSLNAQINITKIPNDAEPIAITNWLVAGSFESPNVNKHSQWEAAREGYTTDFLKSIGGETNPEIHKGTIIKTLDGKKIRFKSYQWEVDYLDLTKVFDKKDNVCAYLYAELESDTEQIVAIHLGTNDTGKLWIDGKLSTAYPGDRVAEPSQNTAQVKLFPKKRISILLKIDNGGGGWGAYLQVYGESAHEEFIKRKLPESINIGAVNQYLSAGENLHAFIEKHSLNWFELNGPVKWELKDGDQLTTMDVGDSDQIDFTIPNGLNGVMSLIASKQVGDKVIQGELQFTVRKKDQKVFKDDGEVLNIGNRRELFVDHYLIHKLIDTQLVLHEPKDEGEVLRFDKPWEGPFCAYVTIIKEAENYKAYYRGTPKVGMDGNSGETTCYAESKDGIHWEKPSVGTYEIMGTRDNNVVLANDVPFSHNFSPFLDTKPNISSNEKYKAVAGVHDTGLFGFTSKDGIHWKKTKNSPIFTKGIFDSQNVVFWSSSEKRYVCYFRIWSGAGFTGVRTISRTTSKDFIHWEDPVKMKFGATPIENLYTNQTSAYFRAPHIYVSIAARFMPGRQVINDEQAKIINVNPDYFKDCSDVIFMTTRGGNKYDRTFMESFIKPGIGIQNWVSRSNYPALNVVQTSKNEMSVYVQKNYAQPTAHLNRYSLRLDGFSSLRGSNVGGEMITKLLTFEGKQLSINFATSAAGEIAVEIQDKEGNPIPGFSLVECQTVIGNEIDRIVHWKNGTDVSILAGKEIRLRFSLKDADLYSIRFK